MEDNINHDRTKLLQLYFSKYLTDVRGLKKSTAKHYIDALNNISRRLEAKGLVENDIYEIRDLDTLYLVKEVLDNDADYVELNSRGNQMYSAGLKNYFRFAEGKEFFLQDHSIDKMDMPVEKEDPVIVEQKIWKRSDILRTQVLTASGYMCEISNDHESFIAEATNKLYMEGHHAIPMRLQDQFKNSLDVYANIVCLCPLCHRKIHHGLKNERQYMLQKVFDKRAERLNNSGIVLSEAEFMEMTL